jgi:hypothetical protein
MSLSRQRRNHRQRPSAHGSARTGSTPCVPRVARGGLAGMYRLTVRGDTRMPSFTRSSAAIRSSPHLRFAVAIVAISARRSAGIGGRPAGRDFQRQNSRKPCRCQRISVSGFTKVSKRRHSRIRDKATSVMRVASSAGAALPAVPGTTPIASEGTDSPPRVGHVTAMPSAQQNDVGADSKDYSN